MIENIQLLYDDFFKKIKAYLLENSIYSPSIFKKEPEEKIFPIVIVNELPRTFEYTTLKYTDEIHTFAMEINIYSMQKGNVSAMTIADELTNLIEKYFYENYKVKIKVSKNVSNIDTAVIRNIIQISCNIDTKYKNKLIIYPSKIER